VRNRGSPIASIGSRESHADDVGWGAPEVRAHVDAAIRREQLQFLGRHLGDPADAISAVANRNQRGAGRLADGVRVDVVARLHQPVPVHAYGLPPEHLRGAEEGVRLVARDVHLDGERVGRARPSLSRRLAQDRALESSPTQRRAGRYEPRRSVLDERLGLRQKQHCRGLTTLEERVDCVISRPWLFWRLVSTLLYASVDASPPTGPSPFIAPTRFFFYRLRPGGGRPQQEPSPRPRNQDTNWYGWQTLIPDGVGAALVLGAFGARDGNAAGVLYATGLGVVGLDGPIVHIAHRRYGVAAASLGLRVGAAVLGALVGGAIAGARPSARSDEDVPAGLGGVIVGFSLGAVAGAIIDDASLAWEPTSVRRAGSTAPRCDADRAATASDRMHISVAPLTGSGRSGMVVAGTF